MDRDSDPTLALSGRLAGQWSLVGGPKSAQEQALGVQIPTEFTIRLEPGEVGADGLRRGSIVINGHEEQVSFGYSVRSPAFSGIAVIPSATALDGPDDANARMLRSMVMALLVEDANRLPDELFVDFSAHTNPTHLEEHLLKFRRE